MKMKEGLKAMKAKIATGNHEQAPNIFLPASKIAISPTKLSATLANEISALISHIGAERLMFGSGMPFKYPDPAIVKMEVLDVADDVKEKIFSENALKLL